MCGGFARTVEPGILCLFAIKNFEVRIAFITEDASDQGHWGQVYSRRFPGKDVGSTWIRWYWEEKRWWRARGPVFSR